jgi:hypothetical protein
MVLKKFVQSVWDKSGDDLEELERLKKVPGSPQKTEDGIYLVTVKSNADLLERD